MNTLISADNTWVLMSIMVLVVAFSIWMEQTYAWASKISGAIIALICALLLTNLKIIPASAPIFDDVVWGFAVPMAIPLLLLQVNLSKIWKETGRMLGIFLIGALGTVAGAVLGVLILGKFIPNLPYVAAMMTGSYIGGGVNFTALADAFHVDQTLISAATVADNLNMAIYFMILIAFAGNAWLRKHYPHPHIDHVLANGTNAEEGKTLAAKYWGRKEISLRDIAIDFAFSIIVVTISKAIAGVLSTAIPTGNWFLNMLNTFFGSQYVWITTVAMLFATVLPEKAEAMHGAQELGTYLIYLFFFVIGVPASIPLIIQQAPLLLVFCLLMVIVNMLFCFIGGKLIGGSLEEIILASNANIGGPTTAAGMAIAQGWNKLVGPCMLVGTFGYVVGTYLGIVVGSLLIG
ncbi:MAG: DUF819 family protein [Oribacterium sp.]|nr:DUF819 family protein [Oribacterium sp.]